MTLGLLSNRQTHNLQDPCLISIDVAIFYDYHIIEKDIFEKWSLFVPHLQFGQDVYQKGANKLSNIVTVKASDFRCVIFLAKQAVFIYHLQLILVA